MKEFEYFIEGGNGIPEIIEFPDDMANIAESLHKIFPDVKLEGEDAYLGSYNPVTDLFVLKDKKSLKFGVNTATNRLDRDLGNNLYMITITKFDPNECK